MTKIKKGSAPLYLSYVDTINGMLGTMTFDPELPPHKKAIDRSGRNVEWLRKAFKRGTMSTHPDFAKLTQLLEVPFQAKVGVDSYLEQEMDKRIDQAFGDREAEMNGVVHSGRIAGKGPNPIYDVRVVKERPAGPLNIPVDFSQMELNAGLTTDQVNKFSPGSHEQQTARAKRNPSKNVLFAERYGQPRRPGQPEPILMAHTSKDKSVAHQVIAELDNLPDGEYKLVDGKIVREGA